MELNAKNLHEVRFESSRKGYDPNEVDDFISAVAEGVEELQERLRRATERANRAEQQLATAQAAPAVPAPVAQSATASPELSKVWERALAAAESAVEEAKLEAQRILDEARGQSEGQIATARSEANRIAEEAQMQLRSDIGQLEEVRSTLSDDVNRLNDYLDQERDRARAVLQGALSALEGVSAQSTPPPAVAPVDVPRPSAFTAPFPEADPAFPAQTSPASDYRQYEQPSWEQSGSSAHYATYNEPAESFREGDEQRPQEADTYRSWENASGPSSEANAWSAPSSEPAQSPYREEEARGEVGEEDSDPFLAELRRAVRDDNPLGPRDVNQDDDDSSIASLYAEDEDDGSSFFKRKK